MSKFDFNVNDLDPVLLNKQIQQNVDSIYNSPPARRGRSRAQIEKFVKMGIPCEVALIQFHGCSDYSEHIYGDVIAENGMKIECKASETPWTQDLMEKKLKQIGDYCPSDIIMFWNIDGDNYTYYNYIEVRK